MMGLTVRILLFAMLGICTQNLAQPVVKYYAMKPDTLRMSEISEVLPYTRAHPHCYLVKIHTHTTRNALKKAGLEVVRELRDGYIIIRSAGKKTGQYSYLFEHTSPVNHLWKLSDDVLNASGTTQLRF